MRLTGIAAPLVVAAALGLAACGGDDSGDSGGSDDFIADADAICTDAVRQLADQELALSAPPVSEADIAALYEVGNPVLADAQAQLEALEAPADVSADWDEYLSLNQQRTDAREQAAVAADDPKAFAAANGKALEALTKRDEVGARIGLGACANVLSEPDQQAITAAEEEFAAAEDPQRTCTEIFLEQYIESLWRGDVQKCIDDPVIAKQVEVDISKISGVDGIKAQVELELVGGQPRLEGHPITDYWYYVDGEWRLYDSFIE